MNIPNSDHHESDETPTDALHFARLAALSDRDPDAVLSDAELDDLRTVAGGETALADRIEEQSRLRNACASTMDRPEHRCPADLRDKLTALTAGSDTEAPAVAGRIGLPRWLAPLAAAAVLAIGTVTAVQVIQSVRSTTTPLGPGAPLTLVGIDQTQANLFQARHDACSDDLDQELMGVAEFPTSLDELDNRLATAVESSLGRAHLDLSTLGFKYLGAGYCHVPGPESIHMVYGNDQGHHLSLWVRADDGRLTVEPGKLYGPPADSPQAGRLVIWRDGDVIFYLFGDLPTDVEQARPQITLAAI